MPNYKDKQAGFGGRVGGMAGATLGGATAGFLGPRLSEVAGDEAGRFQAAAAN